MGKCGREISPDRWYRVIGHHPDHEPWNVVLVASAPTLGRAMKLGETAAQLAELQGLTIWVERCYRATARITIGATGGASAPSVEREGG